MKTMMEPFVLLGIGDLGSFQVSQVGHDPKVEIGMVIWRVYVLCNVDSLLNSAY